MSNLRILHAPTEINGQMGILSRAQRELGYHSYSCSYVTNWLGHQCDENLNLKQLNNKYHQGVRVLRFSLGAIWKYDVFHFHFGNSLLLLWNYDLPLLKALGKKMVMHYRGSDIRRKSIAEKNNKLVRVKVGDEKQILDKIKGVSKYIDTAIVGSQELTLYIRDFFRRVIIVRQALELKNYVATVPSIHSKKPIIVHAPSDKNIKGTEYVLKAIDRLEREYDLEFILVHGIPHQQAKNIYQRADITVDQLLIGNYGVFAIESMALGKPVISYISEDQREYYPEDLPILSANPDNIYKQLKMLIENSTLRHELGLKGRQYVEKYHDSLKIARQLIELYESL